MTEPVPLHWPDRIVGEGWEDPSQLLANPLNWRNHPKAQREALRATLGEIGWVGRITVNQTTGHLVDGHLRVEEALSAGITKVPVEYVELDEKEELRMLAILDTITGMASADRDQLGEIMARIRDEESALDTILGDIAKTYHLHDDTPQGDDPGAQLKRGKELMAKWNTAPGQLWTIPSLTSPRVSHRLLCGDSTDAVTVGRLLDTCRPHLMVTDPPYGVSYDPHWREQYDQFERHSVGLVENDDRIDWSQALALHPGPVAYIWCSDRWVYLVGAQLVALGYEIKAQIIWAKQHFVFSRGHYHWQHEPCYYAVKKGCSADWRGDRRQTTLWEVANLNPMGGTDEEVTGHGTQKPLELFRRPIINHLAPGEAVYDPFVGAGTCIVAAEQVGRVCCALEISPEYVAITLERLAGMGLAPALNEREGGPVL